MSLCFTDMKNSMMTATAVDHDILAHWIDSATCKDCSVVSTDRMLPLLIASQRGPWGGFEGSIPLSSSGASGWSPAFQ
jgi:hypothetical protein